MLHANVELAEKIKPAWMPANWFQITHQLLHMTQYNLTMFCCKSI